MTNTVSINVLETIDNKVVIFIQNIQDIKLLRRAGDKYYVIITLVSGKEYTTMNSNKEYVYETEMAALIAKQDLLELILKSSLLNERVTLLEERVTALEEAL